MNILSVVLVNLASKLFGAALVDIFKVTFQFNSPKMTSSVFNPRRYFRRPDRLLRENPIPIPTLPNAPNDKYKDENERLQTFQNKWPVTFIDYHKLALTGMYYIGLRDTTKCHFCGVVINDWQEGDDPLGEHQRFSPTCPLLSRRRTMNIPIDEVTLDRILPPTSPDECGGVCIRSLPACSPVQVAPAFPYYALEEARVTSFAEWPKVMKHKVPVYAEAGFFYTGRSDQVQCFSCGSLFKDWEEEDDPWVRHAIWHPDCKFLKLMKGNEFIEECQTNHEEKMSNEQFEPHSNPYDRQLSVASSVGGGDSDMNNVCRLCYLEERNVVFLPCGHVVACAKCATSVDKCPVCRLPFTDINRLYFS